MQRALMGCIATVERDEAPRRQPESLADLKTTSPVATHTAHHAERKANRTNRVDTNETGARPYRNVGHVKEAIAGLCRLAKHRHGQGRATGAEACDLFRAHLVLEAHARTLDLGFVPEADRFAQRCLRLGQAERAAIQKEVADHPQALTPAVLGELLGLTEAERREVRFRRAEAVVVCTVDREATRKAAAAARKRKWRKANGATPRSECRARERELHPEVSTSTFYRRARAGQ